MLVPINYGKPDSITFSKMAPKGYQVEISYPDRTVSFYTENLSLSSGGQEDAINENNVRLDMETYEVTIKMKVPESATCKPSELV